jgi:hypothetical protein
MPAPDSWFRLAASPSVMRRAVCFALVVGSVLAAINHGDAILDGSLTATQVWKIGLTYLVPYTVSTLSSVGALRHAARNPGRTESFDGGIRQ